MSKTIRIRRNTKANIPVLQLAEPFWATDEYKLYIGDGSTNYEIPNLESTTGTVAKMQLTKDPYPASTAAPASTLAEEIEELRYQLTLAIGRTYWYQDPNVSLETLYSWFVAGSFMAPTGSMIIWTTDTPPTGYLLCNGQAVSRTTYAALFAVIGTAFGVGDGSTTFNVPDMRGRFPLGADNMGGSSANRVTAAAADTIGLSGGAETKDVSHVHAGPSHNHKWYHFTATNTDDQTYDVNGSLIDFVTAGSSSGDHPVLASSSEGRSQLELYTSKDGTGNTGSGGSATQDAMNPYLTINYAIKY